MSGACLGCGEHVEDCSCEERRFWQLREALAHITAFRALAEIGLVIAVGCLLESASYTLVTLEISMPQRLHEIAQLRGALEAIGVSV